MKRRTGYLKKRGEMFYACWTIAGKKFMQTTGQRDRRDAEKELNRIMEPFVAGDGATALQNIAARLEGQKAELAQREDKENPPLIVADAWKAYEMAGNRNEISDGAMVNYKSAWRQFTEWLAKTHPEVMALRDVSYEVCEEYKGHMAGLHVTGRTFNAHRAFLRSLWNTVSEKAKLTTVYTLKDGRETKNPWAKISKRDEHSKGRRPLTVEELRRVCGKATGELRVMLAFGLYLGARMGDAANMDWGNVDLARRQVIYTPSKTSKKNRDPLTLPLHSELYGILHEIPPAQRKGPVTPEMADRYSRHPWLVSKIVQAHLEGCGITTNKDRNGAGVRNQVSVGFHSLRHTAVSLLQQGGAAQSISQAIVGHNSPEVHKLYSHTDKDAMRQAVDRLPSVMSEAETVKALPPVDPFAAFKAKIKALAETLTPKTAGKVKAELLAAVG